MREKFLPEYHDCLRKAGIDEALFIDAIKYLVQEYQEKVLRGKTNQDITKREMSMPEPKHMN